MNSKKLQYVIAGLLVLAAGVALAEQGTVMLSIKQGVGTYLSAPDGKTLYWFKNDSPGKSACAAECVSKWPVFFLETVTPPAGIMATDFGVITRDDGKKQTTFRGYPLYYYAMDKQAGDTAGQGVGSAWYVIDPAAFAKSTAPAAAPHMGMAPADDMHKGMSAPASGASKSSY